MSNQEDAGPERKQGFQWGTFAAGAVVGAVAVLCILGSVAGFITFSYLGIGPDRDSTPAGLDARVQLSVGPDGCTVFRSEVEGATEVSDVCWVVVDPTGRTVLQRNAKGEHQYTHYQSGEYSVHVETWHDGGYVPISNEVEIECP